MDIEYTIKKKLEKLDLIKGSSSSLEVYTSMKMNVMYLLLHLITAPLQLQWQYQDGQQLQNASIVVDICIPNASKAWGRNWDDQDIPIK